MKGSEELVLSGSLSAGKGFPQGYLNRVRENKVAKASRPSAHETAENATKTLASVGKFVDQAANLVPKLYALALSIVSLR
jgi:hypothetical protein